MSQPAFSLSMAVSVHPVFIKARDIPDNFNKPANVLELCVAAEKVAGTASIVGAQLIGGLWRIYPATTEARNSLLIKGIRLRNTQLQLANNNPFILRDDSGEEKPSTKVWVDNVPISVADSEIEHSLKKTGCELRSTIKTERARDNDGKLTRFLTGRRFVFITVPSTPLEKTLKVSVFTARIYHKEQKLVRGPVVCSKCLEQNHHASQCEKDIVCRACKQPGHKRGDAECQMSVSDTTSSQENSSMPTDSAEEAGGAETAYGPEDKQDRGRSTMRQLLLFPEKNPLPLRSRSSSTPKRRRSKGNNSPPEGLFQGIAKCAKRSGDSTNASSTNEGEKEGNAEWG